MSKADSPTKKCQPCMESGEVRPMRARVDDVPMCSSHYNRARYSPDERHKKVDVPCAWCKRPCPKESGRAKRYGGLFCTLACRDAWRAATGNNPFPTPEAQAKGTAASQATFRQRRSDRRYQARLKLARAARGTRGGTWSAGRCGRCSELFVSHIYASVGRYCSDACKARASVSRRRARKRGAHHVAYSRADIFKRDGYRCHLCKKRTLPTAVVPHPRAPVIDHLVPLGPGDDAAYNVATACFLCNSRRRDVGPAQLILFG